MALVAAGRANVFRYFRIKWSMVFSSVRIRQPDLSVFISVPWCVKKCVCVYCPRRWSWILFSHWSQTDFLLVAYVDGFQPRHQLAEYYLRPIRIRSFMHKSRREYLKWLNSLSILKINDYNLKNKVHNFCKKKLIYSEVMVLDRDCIQNDDR